MTPVDWYFARGNKQSGPVSSADLKRLADAGEIRPDDLVWREGLAEWALARNVRGLFADESPAAAGAFAAEAGKVMPRADAVELRTVPAAPRVPSRHAVDVLLGRLRSAFGEPFVDAAATVFRACGLYGLWVAIAVNLALAILVSLKVASQGSIFWGIGLLFVLAAMQYTAAKACGLLDRLNRAMPWRARLAGGSRLYRDFEFWGRRVGRLRVDRRGRRSFGLRGAPGWNFCVCRFRLLGYRGSSTGLGKREYRRHGRRSPGRRSNCGGDFRCKVLRTRRTRRVWRGRDVRNIGVGLGVLRNVSRRPVALDCDDDGRSRPRLVGPLRGVAVGRVCDASAVYSGDGALSHHLGLRGERNVTAPSERAEM